MLEWFKSLGRDMKAFILAVAVPPAGLLIERACGSGYCTICPFSGGCSIAVVLVVSTVVGAKALSQALKPKNIQETWRNSIKND